MNVTENLGMSPIFFKNKFQIQFQFQFGKSDPVLVLSDPDQNRWLNPGSTHFFFFKKHISQI
jgi:hypothetical protein